MEIIEVTHLESADPVEVLFSKLLSALKLHHKSDADYVECVPIVEANSR